MTDDNNTHYGRILSESESQDVQHLQEISGGIQYWEAVKLLDENSWDLERAVHILMGFEESGVRNRTENRVTPLPQVELLPPNQHILRAADAPRGWFWSAALMLLEPLRASYRLLLGVLRFFTSYIWPDPRTQVTDPIGDVRRFIAYFNSTYGREHANQLDNDETENLNPDLSTSIQENSLPFFVGTYSEAVQAAKQNLRFLVVYLHGDSHEDTHKFCKNTLQSVEVLRFFKDSTEFILWGCNIESPEGYRVSRTLREHTYPFVGIIGLTDMPISENGIYMETRTQMALLGRIEGALGPSEFINELTSILNKNKLATTNARLDRKEREINAQLRREQDLAYEASLAKDRAKAAAREVERINAALENEQLKLEEKRKDDLCKAYLARKIQWQKRLPPPPSVNDKDTVCLSLKMPEGSRISRVFSLSDSIKILYYFVLSQTNAPNEFEIVSNYPKRIINCKPSDESDIEDYVGNSSSQMNDKGENNDNMVIHDWHPKNSNDPPSFADMGLIKPELLFILDKNA